MPRPLSSDADYEHMRRLVRDACADTSSPPYATLGDLDWWRATADPGDAAPCQLWHDAAGNLDAFLWPSPTQIDIVTRSRDADLYERVLSDWELSAAPRRSITPSPPPDRSPGKDEPPLCWAFATDAARIHVLNRRGYIPADHSYSLCARALESPIAPSPVPAPCTIRAAHYEDAAPIAQSHRAAFNSARLSASNFEQVMRSPTYSADLHLIAEADGQIAGYVIAWLDPHNRLGLIEPLAVEPRFRAIGLGRALLAAAIERLHQARARTALVNSAPQNAGAVRLYASCGFKEWDRNQAWSRPPR